MTPFLVPLLLAASIEGEAALRHAAALAALGPHTWGSPRATFAAEYVAAEFRGAGLDEVRLEPFTTAGLRGANVVGVLRAPGPEFIVVGAHHDTAPGAPGAYDDGGGVGVLIETARVLAAVRTRPRTVIFVSFDGEEAWSTGKATTTGSRAFAASLGDRAKHLVGVVDIEMCGWKGGSPVLHPIAYKDPLRPGRSVIAPEWLVRAALRGAGEAGAPLGVGDPLISWLYQPTVRTVQARLYGDDLSFLQAGLPAIFLSDSSFTSFYPWYHQPSDTPDKLDPEALASMGRVVLGIVDELGRVAPGPAHQPAWFAAFGHVVGGSALLVVLGLTLVPGLIVALRAGGPVLAMRALQAVLVAVLAWRHPVPAAFVLALPNVATISDHRWLRAVSLLPLLAVAGLGVVAWMRGMVRGVWLAPWELVVAGAAVGLLFLPVRPKGRGRRGGRKKK